MRARFRGLRLQMVALLAGAGMLASALIGLDLSGGIVPVAERAVAFLPAASRAEGAAMPAAAPAPSPSRVEQRTFVSAALGREMPYTVFTPPGYTDDQATRYPVLYMLHGLGGSRAEWQDYGLLDTADRLMRAGEIPPFLIVLAEGGSNYWVDHANGGPAWGTYVARDLVAAVDGAFRTRPTRGSRAIGGDSMGGHGALQLAINHPQVFGVVGAHSFALRRHETAFSFFGNRADFNQRDPVFLYHARADVARTLTLWLDMGDEDVWHPAARAFHQQLVADGIPHRWHEYRGGHTGEYWTSHTTDYLRFYGASLGGAPVTAAPAVSPVQAS